MKTIVLHEDPHLLVIHKPAGIAVQSARIGQMDVESELKNYLAKQKKNTSNIIFWGLIPYSIGKLFVIIANLFPMI